VANERNKACLRMEEGALQSHCVAAGNGLASSESSEHRSKKKKKRKDKEKEHKGSTTELAGHNTEASPPTEDQPQKKLKLMINFHK